MSVTIWHNPKCTTSCKVLARIRESGVEPTIVEYVKNPPNAGAIAAALKDMAMTPRALLRRSGTPYDELGLDDESLSDAALIEAMATHSLLIQRPVVFTEKGTRLCRPVERLDEIL